MLARVLKNDPAYAAEDYDLEFRLTYEGPLYADSRSSGSIAVARAKHKQEIRKVFHKQLKRLWEVAPQLNDTDSDRGSFRITEGQDFNHTIPDLAARFTRGTYRFVPLATRLLDVGCSVDVLFLRTDAPGSIISAGDIDNRLKTVFDALTMPTDTNQLGGYAKPEADEDPFFCLLEDDRLMTRASVDTDRLLQDVSPAPNPADARLVITVRLTPLVVTPWNLRFG